MPITAAIDISAPPEKVWAILTDFARYREWNPFMTDASGVPAVGEHLNVFIRPPGASGMRFHPRLLVVEPNRELRWRGTVGVRGVFDGEHRFVLTRLLLGGTRFEQSERFSGLLSGLVADRAFLASAEQGFHAMNAALRTRAEAW